MLDKNRSLVDAGSSGSCSVMNESSNAIISMSHSSLFTENMSENNEPSANVVGYELYEQTQGSGLLQAALPLHTTQEANTGPLENVSVDVPTVYEVDNTPDVTYHSSTPVLTS